MSSSPYTSGRANIHKERIICRRRATHDRDSACYNMTVTVMAVEFGSVKILKLEICSGQGVVGKRAIVMGIHGGIHEADRVVGVVDGLDYVFMRENGEECGFVVFTT